MHKKNLSVHKLTVVENILTIHKLPGYRFQEYEKNIEKNQHILYKYIFKFRYV